MTKPQEPNPATEETNQPAGERKRDEAREEHAAYGGQGWKAADERGDQRYGTARNDDADPLTLAKGDKDVKDADGAVEAGGEHAGMGRGEAPRKPE